MKNKYVAGAAITMLGLTAFALGIRYFGNQPGISEVAKGLRGEVR